MTLCLRCGKRIDRGSYCALCLGARERREQARKNREFGGSGGRWQTIRRQVFARQEGMCARCGRELQGQFEVDHVVPRAAGGGNELENLQALHVECHRAVTRTRERSK